MTTLRQATPKASGKKSGGTPAAIRDRNRKYQIKAALAGDAKRNGVKARRAHRPRGPPDFASIKERLEHRIGLFDKREICLITGATFPTVWSWMRSGRFPLARAVAGTGITGKSKWHASEVAAWLDGLPMRKLKAAEQKVEVT